MTEYSFCYTLEDKLKQILVMRKDLNMRKGKMCSQAAHASLKATLENLTHPSVIKWLSGNFTKITVSVDSEEQLFEVMKNAENAGIITTLITDAGRTEFDGVPTNTCIAVGPASDEELTPITGHLKLL
jgi:peptidyl-tRNA hydrolase, PTH2 family